jgi:membrane protease YdiL (CAAX protease family)
MYLTHLDLVAIWFLFIFGVFVPYIAFKSGRRIRVGAPVPPRKRIFINVLVMQGFFLVISLLTARSEDIQLFPPGRLSLGAVIFALGMLGICLSVMPLLWRKSSEDEKRRALLARPNEPKDLGWWFLVSLAAGTVEEITYRGVMFALALAMTRNWWMAVAICVLFFALGHANQKLSRMIFVGVIAIGCHVLVWMTGALYLAMAVHFTYDFIAGIIYLRWAQQMRPAA